MPYAIVIHAFPRTDLLLAHAQGKILHGLFYELLQKASAAKGDEVHSAEGLKPFSTALLLNERQRHAEYLRAGEELKIRFTFLDDSLYPLLRHHQDAKRAGGFCVLFRRGREDYYGLRRNEKATGLRLKAKAYFYGRFRFSLCIEPVRLLPSAVLLHFRRERLCRERTHRRRLSSAQSRRLRRSQYTR